MPSFVCNICGYENHFHPEENIKTPGPLCAKCHSSTRFRLVALAFSTEVMGGDGFLPETQDKGLTGIGLSDSAPLAKGMEKFTGYTNTYFHKEPSFDIADPNPKFSGLDFIISSDVFEHTKPPAEIPFLVAAQMLKSGGKLLLSVPVFHTYIEHFPDLNEYQLMETTSGYRLVNATNNGNLEIFSDLRFHGGPGTTLEMRIHSRESVENALSAAKFKSWKEIVPNSDEYGISPLNGLSTLWVAEK